LGSADLKRTKGVTAAFTWFPIRTAGVYKAAIPLLLPSRPKSPPPSITILTNTLSNV
jgi:hypothetical protein